MSASTGAIGVLRCPTCGRSWLVVGLKEGDRHICKECGREFSVTGALLQSGATPARRTDAPGVPDSRGRSG